MRHGVRKMTAQQATGTRVAWFIRNLNISDYYLISAVAIIIFLGLIMLSSATSILSFKETSTSYYFVKQQLLHGVIPGIILFFITLRLNYRVYNNIAWFLYPITLFLLLIVFIPQLSFGRGEVRSWVSLFGITIQTSEIAKLALVLWLAAWLSKRERFMRSFTRVALPFFLYVAITAGLLLLQPDIGAFMLFGAIAFVMFLSAKGSLSQALFLLAIGGLLVSPYILAAPYRLERLLTFWNPGQELQGAGYQVQQTLIALGSGSWWGVGIGRSQQKYQFVPEIESDSIFAIIGEEWGFVLSTLLIVLFAFVYLRGLRIARSAKDSFGYLTAIGITYMITIQVLINIGAMVGLLPLTGVPLPFISLGGTNMTVLLAALGILINISRSNIRIHA